MNALEIEEAIVELIRVNSTSIPSDVYEALKAAEKIEADESAAKRALGDILENSLIAEGKSIPVCQDTGYPIFFVTFKPAEHSSLKIKKLVQSAVEIATAKSYLRHNCIDTLTGESRPTNVLDVMPKIYFNPVFEGELEISILQKGGGSENVSAQYSLPYTELNAGRNFEGVHDVVVDVVRKAEGKGCSPGCIGVCVGGDREVGYYKAKGELLRDIYDVNENSALAKLEARILQSANSLGIGPMGLGGRTTLLSAKVTTAPRLPASYFVTVSYNCWALRRRTLTIESGGASIV